MLKFLISLLVLTFVFTLSAQRIKYDLKMPKPQNHYFRVEMMLEDFLNQEIDIKMPIWTPGSYLAREFAKNVNLVKAFDDNGKALDVRKVDKNTWRIDKGNATKVKVNYEVYAFELSVRTSFLDLTHGFVSGSGVFMYVDGFKSEGGQLNVYPYSGFKTITTALEMADEDVSKDGAVSYKFEDYDQLVDCPIEIGNQEVFSFEASGVNHTVAMYSFGNYDIETLKVDMAKVVDAATSVFGQNPNKNYTFIIHNSAQGGGGLEHVNSTVLGVNRWSYEGAKYVDFLKLVAHEYFHLWNVKRIRPIELGPFDYDNENYTTQLWVMEGFTSYYEKLILLRAGFYTEEMFLQKMFSSLNYVEGSVGARVQPVAHASFDAWIKAYRPTENSANTTMSYYSGGSIKAMMIEAMIINKYKGKKCLDDFMQSLYSKYYEGQKRGFSESEFKEELESFIGTNLDDFYDDYINGTKIPDYNELFAPIGLNVLNTGTPKPDIGISLKEEGGKTVVKGIRSESPAEDAGVSVNDEIIGCNGLRADKTSLEAYFETIRQGEIVNLLLARGDQLFSSEVIVSNYRIPKFEFKISEEAKPAKYLSYWLRKK